uniref:Uncharacterized protein n=1 Tax=Romanomermis culicivorax TaxID=13658 RepID=A0A915J106_ROMCU
MINQRLALWPTIPGGRKFHAQRLARRNALIICLLVTMAMITFSCLLLYIFGIFGDEQEFRSYPFKRSTTSFATSTKVSIWVEDYDLIATTTRLFPRSTSTIPTIGSTTTTTKVT